MSKPLRRLGVWLILTAGVLGVDARAQNVVPNGRPGPAPTRRPFARPGTPRRTERIRSVDVQHIKAELTLDTQKREVRGTVTHTLRPLHPYLTRLELDCGPKLRVVRVAAGAKAAPCTFDIKGQTLSIALDK